MTRIWGRHAVAAGGAVLGTAAFAAPGWAAGTPVASAPGLAWGIPFVGLLLSVALVPLVAPHFWHRRMPLVAGFWGVALLVPMAVAFGPGEAAHSALHAVLIEYLPFVALLVALFTAGGGILVQGGPWGTPAGNTLLLAIGALLAGVMGTTGVSMVLIHPLLRANQHRRRKVHLVLFFILLVSNIGGSTTPLGDPPLYVGFLLGVPFAWPLLNLLAKTLTVSLPLLLVFWLLDRRLSATDPPPRPRQRLRIDGWVNVAMIGGVVACVLLQAQWQPGWVGILGVPVRIERLVSMALLAGITGLSLLLTPRGVRQGNLFSWSPMSEVAILFLAVFITIDPVLEMLSAGRAGPLAGLLALTTNAQGDDIPLVYFWMTGMLSAFLDNAPTYLVFFQLAGGEATTLVADKPAVLQAISAGAVFFGALTYIGNAPNLMVRSIAAHRGVRMPGFFGYMGLACLLLLPLFALVTLLFFA
jgi:Na+/H+ antiporter NhaD/arsenite permease-like protein